MADDSECVPVETIIEAGVTADCFLDPLRGTGIVNHKFFMTCQCSPHDIVHIAANYDSEPNPVPVFYDNSTVLLPVVQETLLVFSQK